MYEPSLDCVTTAESWELVRYALLSHRQRRMLCWSRVTGSIGNIHLWLLALWEILGAMILDRTREGSFPFMQYLDIHIE